MICLKRRKQHKSGRATSLGSIWVYNRLTDDQQIIRVWRLLVLLCPFLAFTITPYALQINVKTIKKTLKYKAIVDLCNYIISSVITCIIITIITIIKIVVVVVVVVIEFPCCMSPASKTCHSQSVMSSEGFGTGLAVHWPTGWTQSVTIPNLIFISPLLF